MLGNLFRYDSRKRTKTNLMVFLRPYVMRDANRAAGVTMDRYDYMRRAQAGAQPGDHWLLPNQQAPMLTAPGSAPSVSGNAYDMRPENLAETMRRPPPATVESFAVRQYPAARQTSDPAQPFRVSMPLGVSVARDPPRCMARPTNPAPRCNSPRWTRGPTPSASPSACVAAACRPMCRPVPAAWATWCAVRSPGSGHGVHRHPPVARAGLQERSGVAPMNAALQATAGAAA